MRELEQGVLLDKGGVKRVDTGGGEVGGDLTEHRIVRAVVGRAEDHAEDRAVTLDHAGSGEIGRDVDAAVGHEQTGKLRLHRASRAVDVENGDDNGFFAGCAADKGDGIVERISLDADKDHIGRGGALRLRGEEAVHVEGLHRNGPDFAVALLEAQAFFLHSGEMRTARDERYIRTVFCQKSTERSACPARADDHIAKSHILSSLKLFVQ